jgi:type IV pilus assembly protein PilA
MKTDFQTKFLQHLLNKKDNAGFTLIELLVVIIIIGILSAIALPSFLNQANKAKQSEAKTYVGSMNRAQQAYYLEKSDFIFETTSFGKLGLGVATQTTNYKYFVNGASDATTVSNHAEVTKGTKSSVKAYIGGVTIAKVKGTNEASTLAVLCEGAKPPVNDGAQGVKGDAATGITFSTDKAPECDGTIYEGLQ